jgi:hypothetical protein
MIRVRILVEGATEESFVNNFLKPHLVDFNIDCVTAQVTTSCNLEEGRVFKGGGIHYPGVRKEIIRWMKQEPNAWVTTMFDLYRLHSGFPCFNDALALSDCYAKIESLEKAFHNDIIDNTYWRFIPYIQLHEFESILFSDINKLSVYYIESQNSIEILASEVSGISPELIDDGLETAPSKRIISKVRGYNKVAAGTIVAISIGLDMIRAKCSHFDRWLTIIESKGNINL